MERVHQLVVGLVKAGMEHALYRRQNTGLFQELKQKGKETEMSNTKISTQYQYQYFLEPS